MRALVIEQLGGERPRSDARRVGLDDAEHVVEIARTHAGAGTRGRRDRIRRRYERVGAVVDVEERALGAFEQNTVAALGVVAQYLRDVGRDRRDALGRLQGLIQGPVEIDRIGT